MEIILNISVTALERRKVRWHWTISHANTCTTTVERPSDWSDYCRIQCLPATIFHRRLICHFTECVDNNNCFIRSINKFINNIYNGQTINACSKAKWITYRWLLVIMREIQGHFFLHVRKTSMRIHRRVESDFYQLFVITMRHNESSNHQCSSLVQHSVVYHLKWLYYTYG